MVDNIEPESAGIKAEFVERRDQFLTSMYQRKIVCKILRKMGDEYVQIETVKAKMRDRQFTTKSKLKSDDEKYNVRTDRIIWEKRSIGRQAVLYYELGKPDPLGFQPPNYYLDAMVNAELYRRKAFTSLLNKMDTILLIGMVIAIFGMVAMGVLYIYGQTQANSIQRENSALVRENALLKEQLGLPQAPATGAR